MELPATMPAAVYHAPHDVRVEQLPVPEVGPTDVLAEVAWCGVCGSDLHTVIEGWAKPGTVGGHEWSGTVVAAGAESGWEVGDQIVGGPAPTCGVCEPCRAERPALCVDRPTPGTGRYQGAFARYKLLDGTEALKVPGGLELRTAALAEPLAVALHALTQGSVEPGQRVLVSGAGPIGALVVAALVARGIDDVTVSEPSSVRRDLAARLGATTMSPEDLVVPSMAEPMRLREDPFDVAFECSGKAVAMEAVLAQLGKAGRLVLVGAGIEAPRFDPNRILLNELVITGAYEYDLGGCDDALALLAGDAFPVDALIEPRDVPLSGLLEACERLFRGEIAGKVLVRPGAGDRTGEAHE